MSHLPLEQFLSRIFYLILLYFRTAYLQTEDNLGYNKDTFL